MAETFQAYAVGSGNSWHRFTPASSEQEAAAAQHSLRHDEPPLYVTDRTQYPYKTNAQTALRKTTQQ